MACKRRENTLLESDSEDDFLEELYLKTRKAKKVRRPINNFVEWDDEEFCMRFRVSKTTALKILDLINEQLEYTTNRNQSLSSMDQLLLTLRYYATGTTLACIGNCSGVDKATAGRIIKVVSDAIASLRPQFIKLPQNEIERASVAQEFFEITAFPCVFGALDCTHVRIISPGGDAPEEFRNRKDIVARWPGSAHESTVYNISVLKAKLESGDAGSSVVLGDSGYANSLNILTLLRNPQTPEENLYNKTQIRTRNPVERLYGVIKARFPVLALGIRLKLERVQAIIVACAVLHNIAIDMKEQEPRIDPAIEERLMIAINKGQMENIPAVQDGTEAVRRTFIEYFHGLL